MPNVSEVYGKTWDPDDYLVVLDAFFRLGGSIPDAHSAEIQELSRLIGRTPSAIVMRMENFASLDQRRTEDGCWLTSDWLSS